MKRLAFYAKMQKTYSNIDFCVSEFLFCSSFCRDLHLDDVTNVAMLSDAKFLVKRATDVIMQRDNDAKESKYEFS